MNLANYTTATNSAGKAGQYPLSTETLSFLQDQILQLQQLVGIVDGPRSNRPIIIKSPTKTEVGALIYRGEILEVATLSIDVQAGKEYSVVIREAASDIKIQGDLYKAARTIRVAHVSPLGVVGSIGTVQSRSAGVVHTADTANLFELSRKSYTMYADASSRAVLTGTQVPPLGSMILLSGQLNGYQDSQLPLPKAQLVGATLTANRLANGDAEEIGFIQELVTSEGIHLARRVISKPMPSIQTHDWASAPGQVIGILNLDFPRSPGDLTNPSALSKMGVFVSAPYRIQGGAVQIDITHKFSRDVIVHTSTNDLEGGGSFGNASTSVTYNTDRDVTHITITTGSPRDSLLKPFNIVVYSA